MLKIFLPLLPQIFQFVYTTQFTENTLFLRVLKTGKLLRPFLNTFPIVKSGVFSAANPAVQAREEKWELERLNAEYLHISLQLAGWQQVLMSCVFSVVEDERLSSH